MVSATTHDDNTHHKKRLLRTSKRSSSKAHHTHSHVNNKAKDIGMMAEAFEAGRELQMMSMMSMSMSM